MLIDYIYRVFDTGIDLHVATVFLGRALPVVEVVHRAEECVVFRMFWLRVVRLSVLGIRSEESVGIC